MREVVIKVENLGKQYRLGEIGSGTLAGDFKNWVKKISGKKDAFEIGENDRTQQAKKGDIVWAVKDVNFEVKQGEVIGIIGKNGAGKSTLLKMLSRVTAPSIGNIKVKGRIASLLEVGTGFHPDLTGRENIFLNGAILGMTKAEIRSKFDEIVEFSGVSRYIDTPVKRYSSGMYVRLAFAVAAHLEPEILIVDEVLAVGDVEFQRKCLGKMKDVSGQGRTVIFVSHNMGAVKSLCTTGIVMKNGTVDFAGNINDCVTQYLKINTSDNEGDVVISQKGIGTGEAKITRLQLLNNEGRTSESVLYKSPIRMRFYIHSSIDIPQVNADVKICDKDGSILFHALNLFSQTPLSLQKGENIFETEIDNQLLPSSFLATVGIHNASTSLTIDYHENILGFEIIKAAEIAAESYPYEWVVAPAMVGSKWRKI
jgi:lipopolysaccharide transport system ATP-binding protein